MPSESVYGQNFLNFPFLRRSLKVFWLYLIQDPLRFAILGVIEDLLQASCDFPPGAFSVLLWRCARKFQISLNV